jgi:hypothetical protein
MGVSGEGGIDPKLPSDLYDDDVPRPVIGMTNGSFEAGGVHPLTIMLTMHGFEADVNVTIGLDIYRWGTFGIERDLDELSKPWPEFVFPDIDSLDRGYMRFWSNQTTLGGTEKTQEFAPEVIVPAGTDTGYYRVRVSVHWHDGDPGDTVSAFSMGHFTDQEWQNNLDRIMNEEKPVGADFLLDEAGFTVVPEGFQVISAPNKVPDFGDFTTPVIRPGESGRYNFTVTNRYDVPITDVTVTVEFYMWATIEDAKPIEDIAGPPPKVKGEGAPSITVTLGTIEPGASKPVVLRITTSSDTDKGTYFVRHRIDFTYEGAPFVMSSRGYFTWDQWEGFDYSNLWYQLDGNSGIVPDSSFSVKDPVPLWPLAGLITLCVLFGALAVVFYLAEEHGDQYPRLKKGLQAITGKYEQRKRLMQQRMEELRGEDREEGDDEADGEGSET